MSSPRTTEQAAVAIAQASREGRTVSFRGAGSWQHIEADQSIDTTNLNHVVDLSARDLTVTVQAGVTTHQLGTELDHAGVWVTWDPPGRDRTVGSVVATATSGPLVTGFGGIRDQLLGVTFVTGGGRIVRAGGRVMKNVAGFDLTRLMCGSHGSLGMITELHLRLRPRPVVERTLHREVTVAEGMGLLGILRETRSNPGAFSLTVPREGACSFDVRYLETPTGVDDAIARLKSAAGNEWSEVHDNTWENTAKEIGSFPTCVRAATTERDREQLLALASSVLPQGLAQLTGAGLRWFGEADADSITEFRNAAARQGAPVTLERAPTALLDRVGIFGELDSSVAAITERIRSGFDPYDTFIHGRHLVAP